VAIWNAVSEDYAPFDIDVSFFQGLGSGRCASAPARACCRRYAAAASAEQLPGHLLWQGPSQALVAGPPIRASPLPPLPPQITTEEPPAAALRANGLRVCIGGSSKDWLPGAEVGGMAWVGGNWAAAAGAPGWVGCAGRWLAPAGPGWLRCAQPQHGLCPRRRRWTPLAGRATRLPLPSSRYAQLPACDALHHPALLSTALSMPASTSICWQGLAKTPKYIWEAVAHEIGHTLGLQHSGATLNGTSHTTWDGNRPGALRSRAPAARAWPHRLGQLAVRGSRPQQPTARPPARPTCAGSINDQWAPLMGMGYFRPVTTFTRGDYTNATSDQVFLAAGALPRSQMHCAPCPVPTSAWAGPPGWPRPAPACALCPHPPAAPATLHRRTSSLPSSAT
jgi:hypothetical protein